MPDDPLKGLKRGEIRRRLMAAQLWEDFTHYKREMFQNAGVSENQAYAMAVERFASRIFGDDIVVRNAEVELDLNIPPEPPPEDQPEEPADETEAGKLNESELPKNLPDFDQAKDIPWVYANLALKRPDLSQCPSSGAFGMLQHARNTPGARNNFYNVTYRGWQARHGKDEGARGVEKPLRWIRHLLKRRDEILSQKDAGE